MIVLIVAAGVAAGITFAAWFALSLVMAHALADTDIEDAVDHDCGRRPRP